jgi:ATP-dependent protease ClpP protease subunit
MANKVDTELESLKLEQLKANLEYAFECNVNLKERVILLTGEVNDEMYQLLEVALTELESYNHQQVTIRINSEGGDEYAAMAIVGRIKRSKCKIVTEGYGQIMSAAILILASGKHRRLSRYTAFMHHEGAYDSDFERHSNKKAYVAHMEWMEKQWAKWMAEMSSKSEVWWYEQAKHTDKYWTPEQVLRYGVVDELI